MQTRSLNHRRHSLNEMPRGMVGIWTDRALARRALAIYDEAMLKDVGLSSTERTQECRKPFWKA